MKEKAIRERKRTAEETEGRSGYAEEQVEEAGHWAVKELARTAAPTRQPRKPGPHTQEEPSADQADMQTDNNAVSRLRREPVPRERPSSNRPDTPVGPRTGKRQTAGTPPIPSYSDRDGLLPDQFPLHNRRTGTAASHQAGNNGGREAAARPVSGKATRQDARKGTSPKQGGAPGKHTHHNLGPAPASRAGPGRAHRCGQLFHQRRLSLRWQQIPPNSILDGKTSKLSEKQARVSLP